jgi:large subunit ribosomal protein L29
MKYTDLTKLGAEELAQHLLEAEETLRKLRFSHGITPLEKPSSLKQQRKLVARIKTAQNEKRN